VGVLRLMLSAGARAAAARLFVTAYLFNGLILLGPGTFLDPLTSEGTWVLTIS